MTFHTKLGGKYLRVRFDQVDLFIIVYDGTRYLVLFSSEKYDAIHNRIRFLISQKSGITYIISQNYVRIKIDLNDSLPIEITLTLHNVIILIKSVFNKNRNLLLYYILRKMFVSIN